MKDGEHSSLHDEQRSDSRQEKGGPLCAEGPNLRGNTEGVPSSIRSFTPFTQENGSNSAQRGTLSLTHLRTISV